MLVEAGIVSTSRAEEYRRLAQECLTTARTVSSGDAQTSLLQMAQVWLRLADEQEASGPNYDKR
jgi:hypothetical protein